jgi:acetyl esterase/lipase
MSPLGLLRRLVVLARLGAPPALTFQVVRWATRVNVREFAFHWAALFAIALGLSLAVGWPEGTAGAVVAGVLAVALVVELRFAWIARQSAAAVARELSDFPPEPEADRFPRSHLVVPALMLFSRRVRVERGVVYHREERRRVRLDIYRPTRARAGDARRPAVIQVHGGGWILGSRVEQGIPLLTHLAANGWVGFNVDYWLSPRATMPAHVVDVKRAIAWVREHAEELGIDPSRICLTGGSAGGHLTALAAMTANHPALQPGFESADTSVAAAVPFYGIYDFTDPSHPYSPGIRDWLLAKVVFKRTLAEAPDAYRSASPTHRVHAGAPPFLVFHGEHDTLVPVEDVRAFVERLEGVSSAPAHYVELPGCEHAFDIFPSPRTAQVVEGIERFLRAVVRPPTDEPGRGTPAEPAPASERASMLRGR